MEEYEEAGRTGFTFWQVTTMTPKALPMAVLVACGDLFD
jgi:hypothetical protein